MIFAAVPYPMSYTPSKGFCSVALTIIAFALYGQFVHNPFVFDDEPFFVASLLSAYAQSNFGFTLRWIPYHSFGLTYEWAGADMPSFRAGNILLHAAVGIALFAWSTRLLHSLRLADYEDRNARFLTFTASAIFLVHPLSVYAVGYLVQRPIVLATLFVLLMLFAFHEGTVRRNKIWLWAGVAFYFLAVFSKEHAIAAPAVCAAQTILVLRSNPELRAAWRLRDDRAGLFAVDLTKAFVSPIVGCALVGVLIAMRAKGVLGSPYEPFAAEMLARLSESGIPLPVDAAYSLSVLNQCALFFKYIALWLVPYTGWMSVDMREPFAGFLAFPQTFGVIAFILYPVVAARLLWHGGAKGAVGFVLFCPWLLFVTEFSTIRIQEPFVLYRSYLWMAYVFAIVPVIFIGMRLRFVLPALVCVAVVFSLGAYDRLTVFSTSLKLWQDAARLAEGRSERIGDYRIFYNYGNHLRRWGQYDAAIASYTRAIQGRPNFSEAYNNRGSAYLGKGDPTHALVDFKAAVGISPGNAGAYTGMALAFIATGEPAQAMFYFRQSCSLGWRYACGRLGERSEDLGTNVDATRLP